MEGEGAGGRVRCSQRLRATRLTARRACEGGGCRRLVVARPRETTLQPSGTSKSVGPDLRGRQRLAVSLAAG